jgi:MFS family permease
MVSDLSAKNVRGTAFGYYHAVIGIAALPANVLFGWLFKTYGREFTFLFAAVPALIAALALGFRKFRASEQIQN